MKKNLLVIFLLVLFIPVFSQNRIAGVSVNDKVSYNGTSYSLNGAGIRTKVIIRLYVGSLYTNGTISGAETVLNGPVSSVIRLDIISNIITSELMKETIEEGFDKAMNGNTSSLRAEIDDFISIFSDEISKGDQFSFVSIPGKGVTAYKGERELSDINNDYFRKVLFSIWLGENPADARLKRAMIEG